MVKVIDNFKGEYFFLSNFYPCDIPFDNLAYKSSEHLYMALKTTDLRIRHQISKIPSAREAKAFGQTIPLRPNWESIKTAMMHEALIAKFSHNPDLSYKLADTGDAKLIEGNNWHDCCWGVCNCSTHKGSGENRLGLLLMEVRKNFLVTS